MWEDYLWILIVTVFLALFTSFGIGANDVANAFATSVGAKSVTLPQAILIASIFEFSGALLLGGGVTDTISEGLVEAEAFASHPELLMYGMMCVIAATGIWLVLACYLELPVSTTHSTVGGIIGFAVVAKGFDAVTWFKYDNSESALHKFKGVVPIIVSWFTSPILAGLIAALLFAFVRKFILRHIYSYERSLAFFPFFVGLTTMVNIYYICLVGFDQRTVHQKGKRETISNILGFGWTSLIAWTVCIAVVIFLRRTFIPRMKKLTPLPDPDEIEPRYDHEIVSYFEKHVSAESELEKTSWLTKLSKAFDKDVHNVIETDETISDIHAQSETFDSATEHCFSYLQVFTAACVSFAHGANDVANSVGPLSTVYSIYRNGTVTETSSTPMWILALGGFGLVLGLAFYGHTIIRAIGVKLAKISPARGFAMEFSTATVITFGSLLGIPLSTTHCQVTIDFFDSFKKINSRLAQRLRLVY